jgi:hypothetical protein
MAFLNKLHCAKSVSYPEIGGSFSTKLQKNPFFLH